MSSLYIHIPFCRHKCIYCAFYSVAGKRDTDLYVESIVREMHARKDFADKDLYTVYFGGGTPSLLEIKHVQRIMQQIHSVYNTCGLQEVTFEINAEDAEFEYLKALKQTGINRLSIGTESFDNENLKYLNRTHGALQGIRAAENAKAAGFDNISIDLMYSLPFSSFEKWQKDLQTFLSLDVPHVSCYTLMVDEGTMLEKLVQKGKYTPLSEEESLRQADYTTDVLQSHGYIHYETSSYCKPGFHSKHNTVYWTEGQYTGLGAGAHSFDGTVRYWNKNEIDIYCRAMQTNGSQPCFEYERLSGKQMYNEYVMLHSRMAHGLDADYVKKRFPLYYPYFALQLKKLISCGLLNIDCSLTKQGWHLQDRIILELAV